MTRGEEDETDEITHSRTCEECGRETYKFERCHHCGDVHWNIVSDGGRDTVYRAAGRSIVHTERDCVYLREAKRVIECDPETVDGRECRGCQGTERRKESQDHSAYSKLHELAQSDEDVLLSDGGEERSEVDRVEFDAEYPSLDAMEDKVLEYGYAMTARCVRIGDWIIQPSPTDDDCVQLAHVDFKGNVERESRGYL